MKIGKEEGKKKLIDEKKLKNFEYGAKSNQKWMVGFFECGGI